MPTERRHNLRHRIQRPAYASIAEGARSLILDANEQGLAIQSDAPVSLYGRIEVKLDLMERARCIVTAARVAWSESTGRAGIEFLGLSPETRRDLEEWLVLNSQPQQTIVERTDLDVVFASAAERAMLLTCADGSAIAIKVGGNVICRATAGKLSPPLGSRIDSQSGLTGACLRFGRVMQCGNPDSDPLVDRESCRILGIGSVVAAPIVCGVDSVIGVIEVFSRRAHAFDNSDSHALQRLAEALGNSAMCGLSAPRSNVSPDSADTSELPLVTAESVAARRATPLGGGPASFSGQVLRTVAFNDEPAVAGLMKPAGYEFSLTDKWMTHRRPALWLAVGTIFASGLWLSVGPPWRLSNSSRPINISWRNRAFPSGSVPSRTKAYDPPEDLRERAQRGDPTAQLELGTAYASGQDNAVNYGEAVKWLRSSADQGSRTAVATLGAFYWAGRGVTQNYVDALMWSTIAATEGDEASSYRVKILRSRMSPDELGEAQRRAEAWLNLHRQRISPRTPCTGALSNCAKLDPTGVRHSSNTKPISQAR